MDSLKLGFDARLSGSNHTGIGRYINQLLLNLIYLLKTQSLPISLTIFFSDKSQLGELMRDLPSLGKEKLKHISPAAFFADLNIIYVPIKHYSLAEQFKLPAIFRKEQLDLLHVPHFNAPLFYRRPLILTIHDLTWHLNKKAQATTLSPARYYLKYLAYLLLTRLNSARAEHILVPSQVVKEQVCHYLSTPSSKITVTPEGFFSSPATPLPPKLAALLPSSSTPWLLYVGSLYPHKNIEVVLQMLSDGFNDYHLVLVGSRDIFTTTIKKRVQELNVAPRVHWLGKVSDNQLTSLYQSATFLVQPSLAEGFGLTGLEAMASSCPVLAADTPIFREVYGPAAAFFNPHDSADLARAIKREEPNRSALITKGLSHSSKYSWAKTAQATLKVYQSHAR